MSFDVDMDEFVELQKENRRLCEQLETAQAETRTEWQRAERLRFDLAALKEQLEALREAVREHVESAHGQYATDKHAKLRAALSNPAMRSSE